MTGERVDLIDANVRRPGWAPGGSPEKQKEVHGPVADRFRHDLRQPLAAMTMEVDALSSARDLPPLVTAALDQLQAQVGWMSRLLSSAVDDDCVMVVDVGKVVAVPCSLAPASAPYEITFTELSATPVLVDPVELERAARNLIDNATRATAGGGRVDVRVWAEDRKAVLEVADDGPGFGHLTPHQGHGLVGVRRFLERFGGEFFYGTSTLGGALVTLRLPLAPGW
jgi:two-component system sensor histidine kinase MprB